MISVKCKRCTKTVFPMDSKISLDSCVYHQSCAKCEDCNCQLNMVNFETKKGEKDGELHLFCKTHYLKRIDVHGQFVFGGLGTAISQPPPVPAPTVVKSSVESVFKVDLKAVSKDSDSFSKSSMPKEGAEIARTAPVFGVKLRSTSQRQITSQVAASSNEVPHHKSAFTAIKLKKTGLLESEVGTSHATAALEAAPVFGGVDPTSLTSLQDSLAASSSSIELPIPAPVASPTPVAAPAKSQSEAEIAGAKPSMSSPRGIRDTKQIISSILDRKRREDPSGLLEAQREGVLTAYLRDALVDAGIDPDTVSLD